MIDLVVIMYIPRDQYRYYQQTICTPRLRIAHWVIRYLLRRDSCALASGEHNTFVPELSATYALNIADPYVFSNLALPSFHSDLGDINT